MRSKAESASVLSAEDPHGAEVPSRSPRARRASVILLALFVILGVSAILYLMLFFLPNMYRRQAARMIAPTIRAAQVGDVVYLGAYEQDNDESNGAEPIEWIVLDRQEDRSLLMSRYGLDCVPFNNAEAFVTWDQSSVLTWLNSSFFYTAFNGAERAMLLKSDQLTDTNPYFDTNAGAVTHERLFLANIAQAAKYMPTEEERICIATPYAVERGVVTDKETGGCLWWLRSPGFDESAATRVLLDGRINYCGYRVQSKHQAVRPFVWVTFDPEKTVS